MKTSEIIRDRIDNLLTPYFLDMDPQADPKEHESSVSRCFLCLLFKDQPQIVDYIQQDLKEQNYGQALWEPVEAVEGREPYRPGVCRQQIYRFFYADMMAAYFESIGD